jgi:hypothetical protein
VFVVDAHARHGAQFDILYDPAGRGHYGVRAEAVLTEARPGVRWPRAAAADELLYLIRKRMYKDQPDRVDQLLDAAEQFPTRALQPRIDRMFSPASASAVSAALAGHDQPSDRLSRTREVLVNGGRIASRLRHPVGFWVALGEGAARSVAELVAMRFGRVLPASGCGDVGGGLAGMRSMAAVRWRAGVYASWGRRPPWPEPDLIIDADDGDTALRRVVSAMEKRLRL